MDIQALFNAMSNASRHSRSNYHLTLGRAIRELSEIAPSTPITIDDGASPGAVISFRGYYSDLCFPPNGDERTVGDVLSDLKAALGSTFEGYKGGDFLMGEDTPLWVAPYGFSSNQAVMGIEVRDGRAVIVTRELDE